MSWPYWARNQRARVVAPPPPPPPPPPISGGFAPNEPSGFTTFLDHVWNSTAAPSGWYLSINNSLTNSILTGPGPEHPTSWGIEQTVNENGTGQIAILDRQSPTGSRRFYTAFAYRFSPNFAWHVNGTKVIYPFLSGTGRPFEFGFSPLAGQFGDAFNWRMFTYYLDNPGIPKVLAENQGAPALVRNKWYRMELLVENNAVLNQPTGRIRWWNSEWNGSTWGAPILRSDNSNIVLWPEYMSAQPGTWGLFQYNLYYGGSGPSNIPEAQVMEINRLYQSHSTVGI